MTVQEICDALENKKQAEVAHVTAGAEAPGTQDAFETAESAEFLQDGIDTLTDNLQNPQLTSHMLIGPLEDNAFRSSLQRTHNMQSKSRVQRWSDIYTQRNRISNPSGRGALREQLRHIGVKVDDEFITKIIQTTEENS
jgi:hypothetical protein